MKEVHFGQPWMGSTYSKKLNQIDETEVFIRPINDLHSIAEIMSHLTLWRSEAIVKIKTGRGTKTDDCEENWLSNEQLKSKGWHSIKTEFDSSLEELISLIEKKDDDFLKQEYYDTDFKGFYTYLWLLNGMIQHDAYHLGQIGIVVKFLKKDL